MLPPAFMSNVRKTEDGCWDWTAAHAGGGYGVFYLQGRQQQAHRVAYEALRQAIPDGLEIDHLCRNRGCVNPDHLEPVTRRENLLRSPITLTAQKATQSACIHGHEFTTANTRIRANGTRTCIACIAERNRHYWLIHKGVA